MIVTHYYLLWYKHKMHSNHIMKSLQSFPTISNISWNGPGWLATCITILHTCMDNIHQIGLFHQPTFILYCRIIVFHNSTAPITGTHMFAICWGSRPFLYATNDPTNVSGAFFHVLVEMMISPLAPVGDVWMLSFWYRKIERNIKYMKEST